MKKVQQLCKAGLLILLVVSFSGKVYADETISSLDVVNSTVVGTSETVTENLDNVEENVATESSNEKSLKPEAIEKKEASKPEIKVDSKNPNSITLEKEKHFLKNYLEDDFITQVQYEETLNKLMSATTDEEIQKVMKELEDTLDFKALLHKWTFAESYINIKGNIEGMIADGSLTKEQGQDFLNQLENSTTKEELTSLWEKVGKFMKEPQETTESLTNSQKAPVTPVNSKVDDKQKNEGKKLPQTGEINESSLIRYAGMLLLVVGIGGLSIKLKRTQLPIKIK